MTRAAGLLGAWIWWFAPLSASTSGIQLPSLACYLLPLAVGNGQLTVGEQRTHFALWALLKSPLLIGADVRSIHPSSLEVLKAAEVIAIHQDELGVAGDLIWQQGANRVSQAVRRWA